MSDNVFSFQLIPDRKGMVWDLLLYVPTVSVLGLISAKLWYGNDQNFAYLLFFLASFFFIAGANRILKTRLILLPSAPTLLQFDRKTIHLTQRNGEKIALVKKQRFYSDYAGRSFGISGLNGAGNPLQFVFHKAQFSDASQYNLATEELKRYFQ